MPNVLARPSHVLTMTYAFFVTTEFALDLPPADPDWPLIHISRSDHFQGCHPSCTARSVSPTTGSVGRSRGPISSVSGVVGLLMTTNGSDPRTTRTIGTDPSNRLMAVWHRVETYQTLSAISGTPRPCDPSRCGARAVLIDSHRSSSLFSNPDDVDISFPKQLSNTKLVPYSAQKLRGRLKLREFEWVETWTGLITCCRGLRFRCVDLYWVEGCAPVLLGACVGNLETLRWSLCKQFDMGIGPKARPCRTKRLPLALSDCEKPPLT